MAISPKELLEKLNSDKLTKEESSILLDTSRRIDEEIKRKFNPPLENFVMIHRDLIQFLYDYKNDEHRILKEARRLILTKKILELYKNAGWKIEKDETDCWYKFFSELIEVVK